MNIEKKTLDGLYRCYCTSHTSIANELKIFFASEEKGNPCYCYSGNNLESRETVWEDGGGTMSIVPLPNKPNEFLAVRDFYLGESPSRARIVWGKYENNKWNIQNLFHLPYIHRFDIYRVNHKNYFIGATIAEAKESKDDWRVPGKIYTALLPDDLTLPIELNELAGGLFRNHGYTRHYEHGNVVGYFGCDNGLIKVIPPADNNSSWQTEIVIEGAISEVALVDIDNDGEDEIMTIEPFHGNSIKIYKKQAGIYQEIYRYENEITFAHALVGCKLRGKNTFLAGIRRMDAELFYVQYSNGTFLTKIIDNGVGPANLAVVNQGDKDMILSANHTANEAAIYYIYD